jgi:tetratricopeptide (TPR) repeat protein
MAEGNEDNGTELRPEARLGRALRRAREEQGVSLRTLAKRLYRSHSNLVEYERGHRLAPLDIVEAYETELGLAHRTLVALHEEARSELYDEDRLRRKTYVLKSPPPSLGLFQLPRDTPYFTGREAELAELRAVVAETADRGGEPVVISAIAGTAGVGKSALALHLAHELAPRFPDAQLYANFHGYDLSQRLSAAQVLDRFLRALGVPADALPTDLDEQAARYRGLLADRRALLVLDNVSSADQVRALLPGASTCLTLITSRDRLAGLVAAEGAHLFVLDPLASEEALDLLARIAGRDRVAAEPEAAAEVTRLCGYLPLAVRVAGAKLVTRPTMSLATLARRLANESRRLGELRAGDVEVRASFALSYTGLPADLARMFRRLGLIAGPDFASGVAAALMHNTPEEAEELLDALIDIHLLEATTTPGRYRLHDLLRLYARERIEAEESSHDREGALGRMLYWYLDKAYVADQILAPWPRRLPLEREGARSESSITAYGQALAWLEVERASLVAAAHQGANSSFDSVAWQLSDALVSFFHLRKYWADWLDTHRVGLSVARRAHNQRAEAWMLSGLGVAFYDLHQIHDAIDYHQQSLAIFRGVEDRWGEGRALNHLSNAYRALGRLADAVDCAEQALAIFRKIEIRYGEGMALNSLGEAYHELQRFNEAIDYLQQALTIRREIEDRRGEGADLNSLGEVYYELQRFNEAIDCHQQSLAIFRGVEDRWGEGRALNHLGMAYSELQRFDEAINFHEKALTTYREMGDRYAEG